MTATARTEALTKLAFFGTAYVPGTPVFAPPAPTVGQAMYNVNAFGTPLSPHEKRVITDNIVNSGIDVNAPAKSLLHAGIGALAGNFIANTLGLGPLNKGLATAIGAYYGYRH